MSSASSFFEATIRSDVDERMRKWDGQECRRCVSGSEARVSLAAGVCSVDSLTEVHFLSPKPILLRIYYYSRRPDQLAICRSISACTLPPSPSGRERLLHKSPGLPFASFHPSLVYSLGSGVAIPNAPAATGKRRLLPWCFWQWMDDHWGIFKPEIGFIPLKL